MNIAVHYTSEDTRISSQWCRYNNGEGIVLLSSDGLITVVTNVLISPHRVVNKESYSRLHGPALAVAVPVQTILIVCVKT